MSRLLAARRRGAFPANATLRVTDNAPIHYDSDSSLDEETRREQEEEEQERELSKRHGEAAEATGGSKKRDAAKTDKDIEAEYAAAARAKKKPRPTLTVQQLVGPEGLIRIRQEFPTQLRYPRSHGANVRRDIDAAAAYSRQLVAAYQTFSYDLCPSFAFEDLLLKIDTLGSKKEVKSYLQTMRDHVRDAHVERLYGKEKAEKMIQELEMGLKQQNEVLKEHFSQLDDVDMPLDDNDDDDDVQPEANQDTSSTNEEEKEESNQTMAAPVAPTRFVAAANPYRVKSSLAQRSRVADSSSKDQQSRPPPLPAASTRDESHEDADEEEEEEASFDDIQGTSKATDVVTVAERNNQDDEDNNLQSTPKESQKDSSRAPKRGIPATLSHPDSDASDDEEEEASFDDIRGKPALSPKSASSPLPKGKIPSSSKSRKDVDDDEEEEEEADFGDVQGISKNSGQKDDATPVVPKVPDRSPLKPSDHLSDEEEDKEEANFDDVRGLSANAGEQNDKTATIVAENDSVSPTLKSSTQAADDDMNPARAEVVEGPNSTENSLWKVNEIEDSQAPDSFPSSDADVNLMLASQPSAVNTTSTPSEELDVDPPSSVLPSIVDDEILNGTSSAHVGDESSSQGTVDMECSEPAEIASMIGAQSNSGTENESPSKHPIVSHMSCTALSQDEAMAVGYSQPSQQEEAPMAPFAQQSQEPSLMNESTQNTIPDLLTQIDDVAFPPSQSQNPSLRERSLSSVSQDAAASCMDETATVIATQGDTLNNFTFPSQSQSQSNNETMSNEHDETATVIPTMSTPNEMDES